MSNTKILVVDDEPDILEFVGYNLKQEGYAVLTANNGLAAIDIAKEKKDVKKPKKEIKKVKTKKNLRTLWVRRKKN